MKLAEIDFPRFVAIYQKMIGYDTPDIHIEIARWLEATDGQDQRLLQVFRNAGKSNLVCLYVAWKLVRDPNTTILVMSAKYPLAVKNAEFIKKIIEEHPICQKVLKPDQKNWAKESFSVQRPVARRDPSVCVSSVDSGFTGYHADLILADDIEIQNNVENEEMRAKLRKRVQDFDSVAPATLFVGTPHCVETIYNDIQEWDGIEILRIPFWTELPNGVKKLAWPERFPMDWYKRYKSKKTLNYVNSQLFLIPSDVRETLIDPDLVDTVDCELETVEIFAPLGKLSKPELRLRIGDETVRVTGYGTYYDPALGIEGRDNAVFAFAVRTEHGDIIVLHCETLPATSPQTGWQPQLDRIIDIALEYGLPSVTVEGGNTNVTLDTDLKAAASRRGIRLGTNKVSRNKINKKVRIAETLEPLVRGKRLKVHPRVHEHGRFNGELGEFPGGKRDDHIDATTGALNQMDLNPSVLTKGLKKIKSALSGMSAPRQVVGKPGLGRRLRGHR
ncbi:phage terminase large subunit [Magnetovibrio sp. PR-2]|uniref:phage terminase large subunit n=1 Tax=Magnetovibrio sp. PR-2 TaxID=3120356 RepID=UPI002FCE0AEA